MYALSNLMGPTPSSRALWSNGRNNTRNKRKCISKNNAYSIQRFTFLYLFLSPSNLHTKEEKKCSQTHSKRILAEILCAFIATLLWFVLQFCFSSSKTLGLALSLWSFPQFVSFKVVVNFAKTCFFMLMRFQF